MLARVEVNKLKVSNGDVNNADEITSRVIAVKTPVIDIWFFLSKLELYS